MKLFLLIVALVYGAYVAFGIMNRRQQRQARIKAEFEQTQSTDAAHRDPLFESLFEENKAAVKSIPDHSTATVVEPPKTQIVDEAMLEPQDFIILTIKSKSGQSFTGQFLHTLFLSHRFLYGKQKLYHRHLHDDLNEPVLYSIASMTEPGFFNREQMNHTLYKGIVIFMGLSHKSDSVITFEKMLAGARHLANALNGDLYDDKRQLLTPEAIEAFRGKVKHVVKPKLVRELEGW